MASLHPFLTSYSPIYYLAESKKWSASEVKKNNTLEEYFKTVVKRRAVHYLGNTVTKKYGITLKWLLNVFVTSYYLLQLSITWGFKFIFRGLRKPFQQIGLRQLTTLKGQFRDHWSHHWSDSFMTPRVSGRGDSFGEETIADFSLLSATLSFCLIGNFLLRDFECTRLVDVKIVSKT